MTEFSRIPSNSRSDNSVKKIKFQPVCGTMAFISQQYISYTLRENPNYPDHQQATMQIGEWPHFSILGSGLTFITP